MLGEEPAAPYDEPPQLSASFMNGPESFRLRAGPLELILRAIGSPLKWPGKFIRFIQALFALFYWDQAKARLDRLKEKGLIEAVPTPLQLLIGSVDMMRFWLSPVSAEY